MTNDHDHIHTCSPSCSQPACVAARGFPPLPTDGGIGPTDDEFGYTADQLRAYVLADRAAHAAEPVAWQMRRRGTDDTWKSASDDQRDRDVLATYFDFRPLYAAPQPAQRDAAPYRWQLVEIARRAVDAHIRDELYSANGHDIMRYLRIEVERAEQPLTQAALAVLGERQRQVRAEGWTPEHDDEHDDGSLAQAAACYALHTEPAGNVGDYLRFWPWESDAWKPKGRRHNLVRAGALILSEIERLDRALNATKDAS